jgi:hypothetical protein
MKVCGVVHDHLAVNKLRAAREVSADEIFDEHPSGQGHASYRTDGV